MTIAAIIPARMGSSRFPGKPLAQLLGYSMIEHVYRRTAASTLVDQVYVATCDDEIGREVQGFGGGVIMTSSKHERASDRVAEAAQTLDMDIVVMVQGDEPMIIPDMVDSAIRPMLSDETIQCVNLAKLIDTEEEYRDRNTIKVVLDKNSDALYFSREPIPTTQNLEFKNIQAFKQVCIIPFRNESLSAYSKLSPTPLEQSESVDMMRFLEHGYKVRMVPTTINSHAVDTPSDLQLVQSFMVNDPLVNQLMGRVQ